MRTVFVEGGSYKDWIQMSSAKTQALVEEESVRRAIDLTVKMRASMAALQVC